MFKNKMVLHVRGPSMKEASHWHEIKHSENVGNMQRNHFHFIFHQFQHGFLKVETNN